jgi:hypothetical protein
LLWGDERRQRIEEALAGITFFIPIVTPRYFQRPECRRELLSFSANGQKRNVDELLLPILYVDVEDLRDTSPDSSCLSRRQKAIRRLA